MKAFIHANYERYLADLETLVNIDSSSDNEQGIASVARFLQERFEALGLQTNLVTLGGRVPCLEARNRPVPGPYEIMFLGHMDTVFPPGEALKRPLSLDGDKAMGPGVCDMKGGLLVVLHVLEALHHAGVLQRLPVCVCFNGDEETGSKASRSWIDANARNSRRVFVFEPCRPGHRFVLRRKGGGWFSVTAKGVSAHAGADPEKGANAVVEIAHQVVAIDQLNQPGQETSAQVTVVAGGDKINIIPDQAVAAVDVRVPSRDEMQRVERFFKTLPDKTHVPGVRVSVDGRIDRPPMEPDSATMRLWELLLEKARETDMRIDVIATGGCSDGNFTSALGVPTIDGMGPVGANSHSPDEYVDLNSVLPQITLIALVCCAIAGQ